ncbi:MAG: hypothetical protein JKY08_05690, partial [Flavobacteriaceae bacterium]|nr:hypothetical protein [Flavobacteriaceae bacterium]
MNNFPFTVMKVMRNLSVLLKKTKSHNFIPILLIFIVSLSTEINAQVTVTRTSFNYFVADNNKACDASPEGPFANYMTYSIKNIDPILSTGIIEAKMTITDASGFGFSLGTAGIEQQSTQTIGVIAPGEEVTLYWFVGYPCVTGTETKAAGIEVSVHNVIDQFEVGTTGNELITVESAISAKATGILGAQNVTSVTGVGQLTEMLVNYEFGTTSIGSDISFQPAGNIDFDAKCFQLVGVKVMLTDFPEDIPLGIEDKLAFTTTVVKNGKGNRINVKYYFINRCTNTSTTSKPFAYGLSGTQEKYTGNFETPDPSTVIQSIEINNTTPILIKKSLLNIGIQGIPSTLTYQISLENTSSQGASIEIVEDILPVGFSFNAIENSGDIKADDFSSIPINGATNTITFRGGTDASVFPFKEIYIPANTTKTLIYSVNVAPTVLDGDYVNSARYIIGAYSSPVSEASVILSVDSCKIGASSDGNPTSVDFDADGIVDACDLDDDNDGILDLVEDAICGDIQGNVNSGNGPFRNNVFWFTWEGILDNGIHDGDTKDFVLPNGKIATVTFSNTNFFAQTVMKSSDMMTWTGADLWKGYSVSTSSAEALYSVTNYDGVASFRMTVSYDDGSLPDIIVGDAESTNGEESIILTSNGGAFQFLQNFGTGTSLLLAGVGTNSVTVSGTPGDVQAPVFVTQQTTVLDVQIVAKGGKQGIALGVFLGCPDGNDFDNDGIINSLDLDSDNDGIYDVIEAGGIDSNNDGVADDIDGDLTNNNGIPNSAIHGLEPTETTIGVFDFLNLDSDEDNCTDADEAYGDITADNNDGGEYGDVDTKVFPDASISSSGLVVAASYTTPKDLDTNNKPDYIQYSDKLTGISTAPTDKTVNEKSTALFSVVPELSGLILNVSYQWEVDTTGDGTFVIVTGATSATLSLSNVTLAMTGNKYRVKLSTLTSVCDSDFTSNTVVLTVKPEIIANNDTGTTINGYIGGSTVTNVLGNDTLGGTSIVLSDVNLTFVSSENAKISLNLSSGEVIVASGIKEGTYKLTYQICDKAFPLNCNTAEVTVVVTKRIIDAVTETFPAINGENGGKTSSVLTNDTLNGALVKASEITLTGITVP